MQPTRLMASKQFQFKYDLNETIIAPVDFSHVSFYAARYAAKLAIDIIGEKSGECDPGLPLYVVLSVYRLTVLQKKIG